MLKVFLGTPWLEKKNLYIIINFFYLFTHKKKLGTPSIKIRNTLKLKKKKFICSTFKKKKKIVTEQAASPQILKKKKQRTASPTLSPWQAQQITVVANPHILKTKKKKKNKNQYRANH